VSSHLCARLSEVEKTLRSAAFLPVLQIPPCLVKAVATLQQIQSAARHSPPQERQALLPRLKLLRSNLLLFSSALERSATILHGYSRRAGILAHGYTPGGELRSGRDPALLDLQV
jgi:hypothetical protein